jgi:hypothetical protein
MTTKCDYCKGTPSAPGAVNWGCTCDPIATAQKYAEFALYAN